MDIYLDNSATTRICPEALNKYIQTSESVFGNPSSLHGMGYLAEKELNTARREILTSLSDKSSDIIFTASGSEANNLAILGRAYSKDRYKSGARIITTDSEHSSVTEPLKKLEQQGFEIVRIATKGGIVDMAALKAALSKNVILVTMMMVNNESGALYDIAHASKLVKAACPEALMHVDATQSYLKIPFTKKALGADMITVSSHKIEGPKGVGALIVDSSVIKSRGLSPIIFGGGQELGLRSGTENVPGIAAFGEAVRIGYSSLKENLAKLSSLREALVDGLLTDSAFSEISITNPPSHAPHILNITLPNIKSETMLHYLSSLGIYVSSGSACSSNSTHHSSALIAYGRSAAEADTSIRISFSHMNESSDVKALLEGLKSGLDKLSRIKK